MSEYAKMIDLKKLTETINRQENESIKIYSINSWKPVILLYGCYLMTMMKGIYTESIFRDMFEKIETQKLDLDNQIMVCNRNLDKENFLSSKELETFNSLYQDFKKNIFNFLKIVDSKSDVLN
jgi:hypothetical protein